MHSLTNVVGEFMLRFSTCHDRKYECTTVSHLFLRMCREKLSIKRVFHVEVNYEWL